MQFFLITAAIESLLLLDMDFSASKIKVYLKKGQKKDTKHKKNMDLPFMISCTVIISSGFAPIMTWNCLQPKKKRWHENKFLRFPNNLTKM